MNKRRNPDAPRRIDTLLTVVVALAVAGCIWGVAEGLGPASHAAAATPAAEARTAPPAPEGAVTHESMAGHAPDEAVPSF